MMDFEEAKRRLTEISEAISHYDDALKPRACDVLIPIVFPELKSPLKKEQNIEQESNAAIGDPSTTFDQLVEKWNPDAAKDRALLAAYFVQVIQAQESISGQAVNTLLKHHGIGVSNITDAIDANIKSQPALMMQLRKSGSSKQARKLYKVTTTGVKTVETRLRGEA